MPKLKPSVLIGSSVLALAAVSGVTLKLSIDADARFVNEWLDAKVAVRAEMRDLREALWGETVEGQAWPLYRECLALVDESDKHSQRITATLDPDSDPADRRALVAEAAPLFELLEQASHSRDVTSDIDWEQGSSAEIIKLRVTRHVCLLAVARALVLMEDGEDVQAVRAILDVQQMARDLAAGSILIEEMIGCALLVPPGLDDCLAAGQFAGLSEAARIEWLDGLRRLRANLPRGSRSLRGEVQMFAQTVSTGLEEAGTFERVMPNMPAGWRFKYSWAAIAADYLRDADGIIDDIESCYQLQGQGAFARMNEVCADFTERCNPIALCVFPKMESALRARFYNLAKLSFLEHGLALEHGQTPEVPEDFFGRGVQVVRGAAGLRIWTEMPKGRSIEITFAAAR